MGIFWRWFGAFVLLAATFNPTRWNFVRCAMDNAAAQLSLTVFLGLVLAIGWIICIKATLNSIGAFGILLVAAVFGSLVWVLSDWSMFDLASTDTNLWRGIVALSLILGAGLSWSILQKRLTGQVDLDEIDNR